MSRPSLTRRLLLTVFTVIVVFFGITVFLLDAVFRVAAERSLRELLDAQMVALIAAADPDSPESVTPTAVLETRFDTPEVTRSGQASAWAMGVRMSGAPSCASTDPSTYSTSECTMLSR